VRRCSHRVPQVVEVAEVWQLGSRGMSPLCPRVGVHDAIVATTTVGLNQLDDAATEVGVMP
jgi:hypothetical protein